MTKEEKIIATAFTGIMFIDGSDMGSLYVVDKSVAIDYNGWNIPGVRLWMPMPEIQKEEKK